MQLPRLTRPSFLKLAALAAICSVGLVAMPGTAAAAVDPDCRALLSGSGDPVDGSLDVARGSSTAITLVCDGGSSAVTGYTVDSSASIGYFDDGAGSGPGQVVTDAPNGSGALAGSFVASSTTAGYDSFSFTAHDADGSTYPELSVQLHVLAPAPTCQVEGPADQHVLHGRDALPVSFSCADNGDGPITAIVVDPFSTRGSAAVDADAGTVSYTADTDSGTGSDTVRVAVETADSTSSTFDVSYLVTDAAPSCSTLDLSVRAAPDAELDAIDLARACSDADGDPLSFGAASHQSAHGSLDTGDPARGLGSYYQSSDQFSSSSPFVDSFAVSVSDGNSAADQTLTVRVTVLPDTAPSCTVAPANDGQRVPHGGRSTTIPLTCSDPDVDGSGAHDTFTVGLDYGAGQDEGFAVLAADGRSITYTSNDDGSGPDTVVLLVSSDRDPSRTSQLVIHLNVTDSAPACSDLTRSTTMGVPIVIDLVCTDADGDIVYYSLDSDPASGTANLTGSSLIYAPAAGFTGAVTFGVLADDGSLQKVFRLSITVSVVSAIVPPVISRGVTPSAATTPDAAVPVVTLPTVHEAEVTASSLKVLSPVRLVGRKLVLRLRCAGASTRCAAILSLSMARFGKKIALGGASTTISAGKGGTVQFALARAARARLGVSAGKTITLSVAVRTTSPTTGKHVTATTKIRLRVPR